MSAVALVPAPGHESSSTVPPSSSARSVIDVSPTPIWMTLFTVFKVAYVRETQAIPFGAVALIVLALVLTPSVRRYASRAPQPA